MAGDGLRVAHPEGARQLIYLSDEQSISGRNFDEILSDWRITVRLSCRIKNMPQSAFDAPDPVFL